MFIMHYKHFWCLDHTILKSTEFDVNTFWYTYKKSFQILKKEDFSLQKLTLNAKLNKKIFNKIHSSDLFCALEKYTLISFRIYG